MCHQLLIIAALLHSTAAVVDCRIACQLCKEKSEHRMLLEVHCALCKECKLRRQAFFAANVLTMSSKDIAEAILCSIDMMAKMVSRCCPERQMYFNRKKSKTTTSTACAMPCVPLCPYPCPLMPYTSTTLAPNIVPQKDVKTPDYYVVYVGLPKNAVMETIETE
ncbi:hypothetical protein ACJJTC_001054 [Scirpophaga incertulas]